MSWSSPKNFFEWLKRVFSLRPIMLFMIVFSILILELRFDWVEKAIGSYLVTTNTMRPKSGTIWEKGQQMSVARKTLEKIIIDKQSSRREVKKAETLSEIAENLTEEQGAMLSPEKLRRLYLKLPQTIAFEIASPFEILTLYSQNEWDRTYLEKIESMLIVYLLNKDNRSLRKLEIPTDLLTHMEQFKNELEGTLEQYPRFENRIYPSTGFFTVLESLPENIKRGAIPKPEKLLAMQGEIKRVGISDEATFGFIEIGFEFKMLNQNKIILIEGQEWAVWDIIEAIEKEGRLALIDQQIKKDRDEDTEASDEEEPIILDQVEDTEPGEEIDTDDETEFSAEEEPADQDPFKPQPDESNPIDTENIFEENIGDDSLTQPEEETDETEESNDDETGEGESL